MSKLWLLEMVEKKASYMYNSHDNISESPDYTFNYHEPIGLGKKTKEKK